MNKDIFSQITDSIKTNYTNLGIITVSAYVIVGVITVVLVVKDLITNAQSGGTT